MATRRVLTPLTRIVRRRNPRTGKREIWWAESADGSWNLARIEECGTVWELWHVPSGRLAMTTGTLRDAQAATADGSALRALAEREEAVR